MMHCAVTHSLDESIAVNLSSKAEVGWECEHKCESTVRMLRLLPC